MRRVGVTGHSRPSSCSLVLGRRYTRQVPALMAALQNTCGMILSLIGANGLYITLVQSETTSHQHYGCERTFRRPGVATMTCTPLRSAIACVCFGTPPYAHTVARPARLPASVITAAICIASSRVGDKISTEGALAAQATTGSPLWVRMKEDGLATAFSVVGGLQFCHGFVAGSRTLQGDTLTTPCKTISGCVFCHADVQAHHRSYRLTQEETTWEVWEAGLFKCLLHLGLRRLPAAPACAPAPADRTPGSCQTLLRRRR